jgi:hypothetical protein
VDKLLGFCPDSEPTGVGVVTECTNFVPYENGMKGAPIGVAPIGVPALAAECQGGVVVTKLDDTRRIFAGTQTKLYELSAGAWVDVSTGSYAGGTDSRWQFAQFGNTTVASNLADTIQRSTGAGFSAASGTAPKAKILFSVGSFLMAMNTNDGSVKPNGWHCCASYDETDWTPSTITLSAKGQLVSSPGQIVAGGKLGDYAVAYKEKAIHIGQFVGAPSVWDWQQIPSGDAGCVGLDAWCDIGGAHFIVGMDNLWLFDGSRPTPLGVGQVRQWFFNNSNPATRYKTKCLFDRQNNVVWMYYCSSTSTTIDSALVYHVQTKQWGCVSIAIEAVLNYISAGVTIDQMGDVSATIDGLISYPFDSQYWVIGGRALSVFSTSHQLQLMTGATVNSSFTTGDVGDDDAVTMLSKIRVRFAPGAAPTSATVQTFKKMTEGDSLSLGVTSSINDGKFDVMQTARFHRGKFDFTGDVKVLALGATLTPEGDR